LLQFLGVNVGLTEGFAAGFTVATLHVRQILIISLLPFFHLFMIGILFYRLRLAKDKSFMSHVLIGCCVLMEFIVWGIGATLALCLFVSMFYLFVYNRSSFIINKPLLFLGRISYCLFLIHQATGFIIIKQCYGHKINPFFGIGIAISVSIVLATLLNFFIEEPARAWVKRFYLQNSSSDTA